MGLLAAGQVVIVHFPFSDLSQSKLRPAVVLAEAGREDWLLCQITSKSYGDPRAIQITAADFIQGSFARHQLCATGKTLHGAHKFGGRTDWRIAAGKVFGRSRRDSPTDSIRQVSQPDFRRIR
jgi:hypothetical protein